MGKLLDKINKPNDIRRIPSRYYPALAREIRDFLLENVSKTGGHLASNLGAVELTMALHLCMHFPEDKLIFDVGHQAYIHKLLTGRKDRFHTLRKEDGLCGFPKRKESECDCFGTGHSSTSIAAAVGFAAARNLRGTDETIIAVLGDGALSGGLAYEALNNLSWFREHRRNFIIVLNDNKMSIAKNVGGMSGYLSDLRSRKGYGEFKENVENALNTIPHVGRGMAKTLKRSKDSLKQLFVPGMVFENMGVTYYGPIDGHDIHALIHAIQRAKEVEGPILIHAITQKGKGYAPAESNPEHFHGVDAFDVRTGKSLKKEHSESATEVFAHTLEELAGKDGRITAITAAMPSGTGLSSFAARFPERFFDVGIAEEYAVTFAAGLAAAGMRPVFAVYSSFLQRAYDQILHDVCIQKLPVFFCIDRAGLVGADGETHQGLFDISYLRHIPNLVLMAPKNKYELSDMMRFAFEYEGPIAMRYPRGAVYDGLQDFHEPLVLGKSERIYTGKEIAVLSVGNMIEECEKVITLLRQQGRKPALYNVRFIRPMDEELLHEIAKNFRCIVTVEENQSAGGYGEMVSAFLHEHGYQTELVIAAVPDCFVQHGTVQRQRKKTGIDAGSILEKITGAIDRRNRI